MAGAPPCPLCRAEQPVRPADKTRAALDAYLQLERDISACVQNDLANLTPHQARVMQQIHARSQEAADLGDKEALCNLGVFLSHGIGAAKDEARAFECIAAAADMGLITAKANLAYCYAGGNGVAQDYVKARECWTAAAEIDDGGDCMYNVGILHREGLGTPKDLDTARVWFTSAAKRGHALAAGELQKP